MVTPWAQPTAVTSTAQVGGARALLVLGPWPVPGVPLQNHFPFPSPQTLLPVSCLPHFLDTVMCLQPLATRGAICSVTAALLPWALCLVRHTVSCAESAVA